MKKLTQFTIHSDLQKLMCFVDVLFCWSKTFKSVSPISQPHCFFDPISINKILS